MKCSVCDSRIKKDLTICPECGNDLIIRHVIYSKEEIKQAEEVLSSKRKAWQERKKELNDLKSELKKSRKEKKKLMEQQRLMSEQMKEIQKKSDEQLKTSEINIADIISELKKSEKEKKKLMEQQRLISEQMKEIQKKSDEQLNTSETNKADIMSELKKAEKEKKESFEQQRSMTKQMEQMQKALEKLNSKFDSQKKKEKTRVKKEKPKKESKPSFFFKIPFTVYIGSILFGFTAYALSPPIMRMKIAGFSLPVPDISDIMFFILGTAIACSVIWNITDYVSLYILDLDFALNTSIFDGLGSVVIIIILTLLIWIIFDPLFHFDPFAFACIQGAMAGTICFLVIIKNYKPGIEKSIDEIFFR